MGLYDNLVASSSQMINTNAPLPVEALKRADDINNARYDESLNDLDSLNGTMKTAQGFFKNDKAILSAQQDNTSADIKNYIEAGDFEHLGRSVKLSARKFGNVYGQISANTKNYQDYAQSLQDMQNSSKENESIDPIKAKEALQASLNQYGDGLQQDPTTGRLTNYFKGIVPSATYDISKGTLEALKAMHPNEVAYQRATLGSIPGSAEYNIKRTTEEGRRELSADKVAVSATEYIQSNPRYMADINSRNQLHALAQGRSASADEFKEAYIQGRMNDAADDYKKMHPKATPFDTHAASVYEKKKATDNYDTDVRNNPDFDVMGHLAAHRTNQYIGNEARLAGNVMGYTEITDKKNIDGTHPSESALLANEAAKKALTEKKDEGNSSFTSSVSLMDDDKLIPNWTALKEKIASSSQAISDKQTEIDKYTKLSQPIRDKNNKLVPGADWSGYIKQLQGEKASLQEDNNNYEALKASHLKAVGMDVPLTPSETLQKQTEQLTTSRAEDWNTLLTGTIGQKAGVVGSTLLHGLGSGLAAGSPVITVGRGVAGGMMNPDAYEQDPRFPNLQKRIAAFNKPTFTNEPTVSIHDPKQLLELNKSLLPLMNQRRVTYIGGSDTHHAGDDVLPETISKIGNLSSTQFTSKGIVVTMSNFVKGGKGEKTNEQVFIRMTPSSMAALREKAGIPGSTAETVRQRDKITQGGTGLTFTNKRGGQVNYTKDADGSYVEMTQRADGTTKGDKMDVQRFTEARDRANSVEGQQADVAIDHVFNTKGPQIIGSMNPGQEGVSFSLGANHKVIFTRHSGDPNQPDVSESISDDTAVDYYRKTLISFKSYHGHP